MSMLTAWSTRMRTSTPAAALRARRSATRRQDSYQDDSSGILRRRFAQETGERYCTSGVTVVPTGTMRQLST